MQERSQRQSLYFAFAIIILVIITGFWLIFRFAESEAEQNLTKWQDRLAIVADSRVAEASSWLNRHLRAVEELGEDASLQLYASQILSSDDQVIAEAQRGFIFSLLSAEAERAGFHESRAIDAVAANVRRPRRAGIALVNAEGQALVATTGMPNLGDFVWPSGSAPFIRLGPVLDDKTSLVVFGLALENDGVRTWLVGAKPLDNEFLKTLAQPGALSRSAKTYIVDGSGKGEGEDEGGGATIRPVTPLEDGGRTGEARQDPAAAFAFQNPGGFGFLNDFSGTEVLVTGRELTAPVPWVLVRTIPASEVRTDINARRNNLIVTLSLFSIVIIIAIILIWRISVSRQLEIAFNEQARLSADNAALNSFLSTVSDSQPTAIAALTKSLKVRFANAKMSALTEIVGADMINRRFDTAFPVEKADLFRRAIAEAAEGEATSFQIALGNDDAFLYKVQCLPLNDQYEQDAKILLVMQDITDLVAAQEQTERLLRQLVATLTEIIDARDPWSTHHSARVAEVAAAIGQEMALSESDLETLSIAGQLVNVGKIFVPTKILTKQDPLTEDELKLVRHSLQKAAGLIAGLDFKGPVARILGQISENWDGSGEPDGLTGHEIETSARILAVANAFVAMVSARSHRDSLGFDKSIGALHAQSGTRFDRGAIAALQNILENRGGREKWQDYTQPIEDK